MPQFPLYNVSLLIEALSKVSTKKALVKVVQNYLQAGAHPFFLQQCLWHARWYLSETSVEAAQRLLKASSEKFAELAKPGHGLSGPLYRVYAADNQPLQVHTGVLHGAFVESYALLAQWLILGQLPKGWEHEWDGLVRRFLRHPKANITFLDNILHLEFAFGEGLDRVRPSAAYDSVIDQHQHFAADFIMERVADTSARKVVEEILSLWTPLTVFRVFTLLYLWLSKISPGSLQATILLREMLAVHGLNQNPINSAVRKFFSYSLSVERSTGEDPQDYTMAMRMVMQWMELLKTDLPNLDTFHAIVRWFQVSSSSNRSMLSTLLAIRNGKFDPRAEDLVKSLIGSTTWKFLTAVLNPKNLPKKTQAQRSLALPDAIDPDSIHPNLVEQKLEEMDTLLERHNAQLAEMTDRTIHASGCELKDAGEVWDSMMQLVGGDVVSVVSPLRQSWMKLERKPWEFLSTEFPLIEVSGLLTANSPKGAECRFRLHTSPDSKMPIVGSMDTEGKMMLADIAAVTPLTRMALQAVVVQSLAAVMVPRHIEELATSAGRGPNLLWEGEVFASRPIVHVVGELGKEGDEEDDPIIDSTHRIHPIIAMLLFQWLLDEESDWEPKLYQMHSEEFESQKKEFFFVPWMQAKNLLKERRIKLSEVFHNTVRPHTRPVPVYMGRNGSIVVRQISERALRNYGRFLRHGGRLLDQRPVRKTYKLPDGGHLILDVARTFNQGTFNSLDQVWDMVPDLSLKARAKERFKL